LHQLFEADDEMDIAGPLVLQCGFSAAPVDTLLLWPKGAPGALGNTLADVPRPAICLAAEEKANGTVFVVCPA
jgi:hypothetical protein